MNKLHQLLKFRFMSACFIFTAICAVILYGRSVRAQSPPPMTSPQSESNLIADFRRVEVASVSDAIEQLTGKRMYMSHRMRPIFTTKFAGFARTVLLKKDGGSKDPAALNGMLQAIDDGSTDSVYVMVLEDGEDIAGMGGLMGTGNVSARLCRSRDRWRSARRGLSAKNLFPGLRDWNCAFYFGTPLSLRGIAGPSDLRRSACQRR